MSINDLSKSFSAAASRFAAALLGGIFVAAGIGILSASLWLKIAETEGNAMAALVLGLLYLAVGCITLVLSRRRQSGPAEQPGHVADAPLNPGIEGVISAFMKGREAGIAARGGRHPRS